MKNPHNNKSDIEILQSLIQKAVRRGDVNIVRRTIQCLFLRGNQEWLRRRATVLVFEECWSYGQQFTNESDEEQWTNQLVQLSMTVKNKNACGLGSLAYQLSMGDETSIAHNALEKDLRIISSALSNPQPFWEWMNNSTESKSHEGLLQHAQRGFAEADQPWDKAFTLAAAYLSVTGKIPETQISSTTMGEFPLWIAIDMHTTLGREKITHAAHQINFEPEKAMWLTFYFEGAQCNEMTESQWWEQEKIWRMKSLGMTLEEGREYYEKLKPVLRSSLKEEEDRLRDVVFN